MCELLGLTFNRPTPIDISFKGFCHGPALRNPDGWGLAYYQAGLASIVKEPISACDSRLAESLADKAFASKLFIVHVRKASRGKCSDLNTHPFKRRINGKDYIFAHNGTLKDYQPLATRGFLPEGETDSEHVFCHLADLVLGEGIVDWLEDDFRWLEDKLRNLNGYGTLNCLMSDGRRLFCYCDENLHNGGLYYIRRESPFNKIHLEDPDYAIDLSKVKKPEEAGYVIATTPLTDEKWNRLRPAELIVFEDGEIAYSRELTKTRAPLPPSGGKAGMGV